MCRSMTCSALLAPSVSTAVIIKVENIEQHIAIESLARLFWLPRSIGLPSGGRQLKLGFHFQ